MVWFLIPAIVGYSAGSLLGFTSAGIGAASVAAVVQSSIGNVAAGSVFATLQSAGATGILGAVGGVCGTIYGLFG